jgi:hypothetical protein
VSGFVDLPDGMPPATSVRAWIYTALGEVAILDEEPIADDGSFTVDVPPQTKRLVLDARSDTSDLLGSVLVASSGGLGTAVTAAPVDDETTLEADVYSSFVVRGGDPSAIDVIDLRARLDAGVAAALADPGDGDIDALADAVVAAQSAVASAYARAGLPVDTGNLFAAHVAAERTYDAALDAGQPPGAAYVQLVSDLAASTAGLGVGAQDAAEAEFQGGAAMRAWVDATFPMGDLQGQVARAGAYREGYAAGSAAAAACGAAGAADALTAALAAEGALLPSLRTSDALADTDAAWGEFRDALIGPPTAGTALGSMAGDAAIDGVSADALAGGVAFADRVTAVVSASASSGGAPADVGDAVSAEWRQFAAETRASVAAAVQSDETSGPAGDLTVVAAGAFRVAGAPVFQAPAMLE